MYILSFEPEHRKSTLGSMGHQTAKKKSNNSIGRNYESNHPGNGKNGSSIGNENSSSSKQQQVRGVAAKRHQQQ